MSNNHYYQNLIKQAASRSVEATISILGITDKGLRQHLAQELNNNNLGLLSDPVFESMFPWEKSEYLMCNLSDNLLLPSLIAAMDQAGDHKFGKDWFPFKHQYKSWKTLLNPNEKKSLVVTSGTGSGKTECFMVPILNDLAKEYETDNEALVGVRALFIYPLNALINSQRERLRAWTDAYGDGLRFCLYNGNTEENRHKDQGKYSNEILTRKMMRETPAPMLVTNATMLEYMLVRQIDEPIIQQSQGKLRWIVLDEAHTYIGSQAAELSLLLRRVMHTFGVTAKNVRFIATSATIGDASANRQLQQYLASLSGVSIDQVVVVGGKRSIPELPSGNLQNIALDNITQIDKKNHFSVERYKALTHSNTAIKLRKVLSDSPIPSRLSTLAKYLFDDSSQHQKTLEWIDACSNSSMPGSNKKNPAHDAEAFLPVRGHLFHQVLSGLWCCADKHCSEKKHTPLSNDWAFGRVYSQRRNHCDCGAPIFELIFCNDCNTPHLIAIESNGNYIQMDRESVDEFSLDYENAEESDYESEMPDSSDNIIIAPRSHPELTYSVSIDTKRQLSAQGMNTFDLNVINSEELACVCCEYSGFRAPFYRRSLLGTPFYITNTIPTLLDACQESNEANDRPNRGRRLITFTDSRQGTARISTKIQQNSERDSIRGLMYGQAAQNFTQIAPDEVKDKENKLKNYQEQSKKVKQMGDNDLAQTINKLALDVIRELEGLGTIKPLSWNDAINSLHASPDISRWIFDYYKDLNPQLFPESGGARILSEMFLLREFSRRPKRQNSMETLGLVSVQYPTLQQIKKSPPGWEQLGLRLDDWLDFLKVTLDFYIRENTIIDIPPDWIDWMGAKIYPKSVLKPNSDEHTSSRVKRWPQVTMGRQNRLVRMLSIVCKLNPKDVSDKDLINGLLNSAWHALTKKYPIQNNQTQQTETHQILRNKPGSIEFHLARAEMAFQVCTQAWICPVTHRLLDSTFKGITPYLPFNINDSMTDTKSGCPKSEVFCRKVDIPVCQEDASHHDSDLSRKLAIQDWARKQSAINQLREENLWTDISDRIIEGGKFYRAAEHSAQQPASKLEKYEALFKSGKLNVLSCSTTMEMGVDIGGISVVAMNNVPPHPANYLQRSGRAGRRGETQALSFTICKDNPHERGVFNNPLWPFTTSIEAPYITLNSERIVQRHINSILLSYFLKEVLTIQEKSITTLNCQWFFSDLEGMQQAPIERILRLLESFKLESMPDKLKSGINQIVKGTILANSSIEQIINRSIDALHNAKEKWLPGYEKLKNEFSKVETMNDSDPFKRKVKFDLKSMGEAYLLSELASRAFLPGYGFPTGIATFDHYSISDYQRGKYVNKKSGRIDNQTRMRERPGRDMAIAIREYAPGSDVVLDGLVYHSAGILLNKFSPNEDFSEPQKVMVEWRCHSCGFIDNESGATFDNHCSDCGTKLRPDNIKEYIEPIGFAVDFYSSPTTDISSQTYIKVQEPWVTANSKLNRLFEPRLGDFRNSAQGHIFNHSSGEYGTGFAVCLSCGKAESMAIDGEYPDKLQPGKSHLKLQGKPGPESSAQCEGADEAYAIKPGVHLGATNQTDVFELYLKHPNENHYLEHHVNDQLPWTLAVVLRQALADIHGINAEEMGYTIKPSTIPDCNYPVAGIVLFDKSGGGSGFSSSAPHHIQEMFKKALEHLQCSDNCDSACQSCLLGYDTRFHTDLLNRHTAIEYINLIMPYLDLCDEAKLFSDSTKYCLESLSGEILASASQGANKLRIFTDGSYTNWDISNSNLKEACLTWRNTFDQIELVLPSTDLDSLSEMHKEDLLAISNFGIQLSISSSANPKLNASGCILVQVFSDDNITTYASSAPSANIPCIDWWKLSDYYLVKTSEFNNIAVNQFDRELLTTIKQHGDVEVELTTECNGSLVQFGDKLWDLLLNNSDSLQSSINGSSELRSLNYSDCYISSPWSLMLLAEIIDSLKKKLGSNWVNPELSLTTSEKTPSPNAKGLYSEWHSNQSKSGVIKEYFNQMDELINISIKRMKDIPHGRRFTLTWEDGTVSFIRFDHGFGCWGIDSKPTKRLDINEKPEVQVRDMFEILSNIRLRYSQQFPTQIFIKKR